MITDIILRDLRQKSVLKLIPKNSVVCDIGCGAEASFLKKISENINFGFGFDKNVKYYKDSRMELINVDFETDKIPLQNNTVDLVTMFAVLEHLNSPENIFLEIFRILKPKGFLFMTTPSASSKPILEFFAFTLKLINQEDIKDHKRYFGQEEIKKVLIDSGFKEKDIKVNKLIFGLNSRVIAQK